ncbi:metal ABC transporter solute-binding protein, Zn/Mn family [Pseudonocardia sp. TRM90224]|uniref:metal ABC transporter solute-binding protein, Zn/Mn family n=1 Tax=Pseudonocardia sp. TRM90224 TaxID=2812678 RepID=UPI001E2BE1CF|nr:zinc ABC transporter substrate-binding protein [Pseudonocardia sp. TRM90224]
MSFRLGATTAAVAIALLTAAGCGSSTPSAAPGATPGGAAGVSVVTSTNVYGSIAEAVGGPNVTVESLITDPAADPHSFESTPADAAKVAKAGVVVFNGGGYDDWMQRLVESAGGQPAVIDVATLSGLKPAAADAEFNEHVWYSLPTVQKLATQLAGELGKVDAANAATYTANASAFNAKIDGLTAKTKEIAAAHPGAQVAITEPVPGYLIEAAGLTDATPGEFAEAIEEDTDPPAAVLQQTLGLFAPGTQVKALVLNAQTETPTTDQVKQAAQTAGVPVVDVTETLPAGSDYVTWMGAQIDALATALNRT